MIRSYEIYLEMFQPRRIDSRAIEQEKRVIDNLLDMFNSNDVIPADYYNKINEYLKLSLVKEMPKNKEFININGVNLEINMKNQNFLIESFIHKTDIIEIKFDMQIIDKLTVKNLSSGYMEVQSLEGLYEQFRKFTRKYF